MNGAERFGAQPDPPTNPDDMPSILQTFEMRSDVEMLKPTTEASAPVCILADIANIMKIMKIMNGAGCQMDASCVII